LQDRRACPGDHKVVAAKPFGGAQAGGGIAGVKTGLHAHLVIGGGEHAAERLEYLFLDLCAAVVVAPGMPHQGRSTVAIALGEQNAREHVTSLRG
jgi:6-phosphogluconate dehydrogenase (decarboxylating)